MQVGNKAGILTVQVTSSLSGGVAPRHAPRAVPRCTALAAARPLARRYPPLSARWHRCGAAPTMRESLSWQKRWSDRRFHVFVFSFRAHVLRVCQLRPKSMPPGGAQLPYDLWRSLTSVASVSMLCRVRFRAIRGGFRTEIFENFRGRKI